MRLGSAKRPRSGAKLLHARSTRCTQTSCNLRDSDACGIRDRWMRVKTSRRRPPQRDTARDRSSQADPLCTSGTGNTGVFLRPSCHRSALHRPSEREQQLGLEVTVWDHRQGELLPRGLGRVFASWVLAANFGEGLGRIRNSRLRRSRGANLFKALRPSVDRPKRADLQHVGRIGSRQVDSKRLDPPPFAGGSRPLIQCTRR
jgi:hypothetical protein